MSTGYKAFKKGMVCKGKQYKENTTYEESGNGICEAGIMHNNKDSAQMSSSGNYAQMSSNRNYARIVSEGKNSVVMAAGYNSTAKAKIGSWITLTEWKRAYTEDKSDLCWIPKCVKTEYVDGERIKENVFYKLENGEFVEAE